MSEENKIEEEEKLKEENAELEAGIQNELIDTEIDGLVEQSFLDYAMSVIVARAIPDVRDGFKPVHRRVIFGMYDGGYTYDKPYVKCAKVVGDVMGKYHPHGDSAIYDTLVRLAQPFSMRYTLVDGHGNFGNMDGDQAAAYRYTECKMNKLSYEMVKDLSYDTVDLVDNYDGSLQEPSVLPTKFPNVLVNGSDGIAVGMATKMPPHNLKEVYEGLKAYAQNPEISVEELMKYIKGPDFPTGGIIYGLGGIKDAYETGRGSFKIRGKAEVKEDASGKSKIIITEIPYQVRKSDLVSKIGELARDKVIEGITSIKDFSKKDVLIEIDLRRDAEPYVILNKLYKNTQLEISYGVINLCIVDGTPKILTLKEILNCYIEFLIQIITRRTNFLLKKDEIRKHIIDGLLIVHDAIDEVVEMAKKAKNPQEFGEALKARFNFDDEQTKAIVNMTLGRLTGIETQKLLDEKAGLEENINKYHHILASRENTLETGLKEVEEVTNKFGDKRRSVIDSTISALDDEDLIPQDDIVICLTKNNYVKRMSTKEFKTQNRGGVGVRGMSIYGGDQIIKVLFASTHSDILFFSSFGRVYRKRGYEIVEAQRNGKGMPILNLLNLDENEKVVSILCIKDFEDPKEYENKYLFFATKKGIVKRVALQEFKKINTNGKAAISFKEDDLLLDVKLTDGTAKILISSNEGKLVMFEENEVRAMGRSAAGVRGINLKEEDSEVVSLATSLEGDNVLSVSQKGLGKISKIEDYRLTHRGSSGVITIKVTEKTGKLVGVNTVNGDEDYLAFTDHGTVIRSYLAQVSRTGRNASGVKMMNLRGNEIISSIAILPHEEEEVTEIDNAQEVKEEIIEETKE